jgi:F420-non-reducing hydrogenase iron-sulfur subunit
MLSTKGQTVYSFRDATQETVIISKELLDFVGLESKRFQMSWVSAAEGKKYTEIISDFVEDLKPLGPQTKLRRNY